MPTKKQDAPEKEEQQTPPVRMQAEVIEDEASVEQPTAIEAEPELPQPTPLPESEPTISEMPSPTVLPTPPVTPTLPPQEAAQPPQTPPPAMPTAPDLSQVNSTGSSLMDAPQQAAPTSSMNYDNSMGGLDASVPLEKKNRKMFAIGIFLLVVVLGGLAFVLYQRTKLPPVATENQTVEVQPGEVVEETPTPTPTPASGLERSEITVEVLNGSGVTGAAGTFADKLEALGYELGEIGNAAATDENELYVQEDLEDELGILLEDLRDELGITKVTGYITDSEATARVVLGVPAEEEEDDEEDEATDSGETAE